MSLLTLRDTLKKRAVVQSSESNDQLSDAILDGMLTTALGQHNPSYTFTTLPAKEEELVVILAWISVCETRASTWVNEANLTSSSQGLAGGYGQDRNNPYTKNMDMAKYLQKRYDLLAPTLTAENDPMTGLPQAQGQIVMGRIFHPDDENMFTAPRTTSPTPVVVLSLSQLTNNSVVLSWTYPLTDNLDRYIVLQKSTAGIHEAWNYNAANEIPEISDSAVKLYEALNQNQKSVKLTGLDPATNYYYLIVAKTKSGKYSYSNEVLVLTNPDAPVISSSNTDTASVGSPYSYQIVATNSPTTFNATNLPAGLSIDTVTGIISGTPAGAGTVAIDLTATNVTGSGTATLTLTVT